MIYVKRRRRRFLDVACKNCGTVRKVVKSNRQPDLCRRCSYDSRSLGPPVKLTCVGYQVYGVAKRATNCPLQTEKRIKTLKGYLRTVDDGEHAFIDVERGQYRCKGCANALFLIYKLESDVRKHLRAAKRALQSAEDKRLFREATGFSITKPLPKIQSYEQLSALASACHKLDYQDTSG